MRPPPRFFKMHTLPLSAVIVSPDETKSLPITNDGTAQSMEAAWIFTPTGAIGPSAATASVEYRDNLSPGAITTVTAAFTAYEILIEGVPVGDYDLRLRVQTSAGFGGYSDWITLYAGGIPL